jgi:maltooligosyltrehalose trehalohydrolase
VPDPQEPETFARSRLDWGQSERPGHARILGLYRRLAQLRRDVPEFTDPRLDRVFVEYDAERSWLRLRRGPAEVLVNFAPEARRLPAGTGAVLVDFAADGAAVLAREIDGTILLAAHAVVVLAAAAS